MAPEINTASHAVARRTWHIGRRAALGLGILALMTAGTAALMYGTIEAEAEFSSDPDAARRRASLQKVTGWTARAHFVDAVAAAAEPASSLLVIDAPAIASAGLAAAQSQIEELQRANAGARRLVLAALPIQDSERLDLLLQRGVDGVFLDAATAVQQARNADRPALAELSASIVQLVNQARLVNPDFLLVLHNAAELTSDAILLRVIDAVAQDNVLFGLDAAGAANGRTDVATALHDLNRVKRSGRPVFVAEHLASEALAARTSARQKLAELGFIGRIADPKRGS